MFGIGVRATHEDVLYSRLNNRTGTGRGSSVCRTRLETDKKDRIFLRLSPQGIQSHGLRVSPARPLMVSLRPHPAVRARNRQPRGGRCGARLGPLTVARTPALGGRSSPALVWGGGGRAAEQVGELGGGVRARALAGFPLTYTHDHWQ